MARFRDFPAVTPAEAERVNDAADFLDRYLATANRVWATQAYAKPVVGSHFELACGLDGGRWAFDFARIHLGASEDHLLTLASIFVAGRLPTYAGHTVLRGSLEASARACWLLDPALGPRQRQERGFTEQLNNLQGLSKFKKLRESRRTMITELRARAAKAGLNEEKDKPSKRFPTPPLVGFGIRRPGPTDLLLAMLPDQPTVDDDAEGAFLYRLVSGSAHSEPWAILANSETVGFVESGIEDKRFEVRLDVLMPVLSKVVELHDRAIKRHTQLMGYPEAEWVKARGPILRF